MSVLGHVSAPFAIGIAPQHSHFNMDGCEVPFKVQTQSQYVKTAEPPKSIDEAQTIQITILSAPCSPTSSVDYPQEREGAKTSTSPPNDVDANAIISENPNAKLARQVLARYPSLSDEQLWEPWFAFPSKPHMTLHRWAEGQKARLNMHIHTLPSVPIEADFHTFLRYSR
ncbi:hypothetical protein I317_00036 [Kwoniella heveanensis CBS 569]|nr:hypothetical protein I317_00036 [Kwoniella heveanensis CBS 569]